MKDHTATAATATVKHSYTIPCASAFRDAVDKLALRRRVNVGDIARSVLLVVPPETIAAFPDPGEPEPEDRETVILKSGPAEGRPWRRKPRLQVRMAPGYSVEAIRRALAMALAMAQGDVRLRVERPGEEVAPPPPPPPPPSPPPPAQADPAFPKEERRRGVREQAVAIASANEEIERLRAIINVLSFEPLPNGVMTRADALHILGFPPGAAPDRRTVRAKFRMLATIHHPDSNHGNHHRMSQLNQAMEVLAE
ncbi:J domain-containing protein [Paramagnetospirillum magneticum]|uniref:J domain-containing protein n=1 Tax=Paramagnetospirillum magneticum (strain ATCC 700264 / AMB-1) TaxID=342108 RepID=Q2VZ49_PARM1|nr:J domain-containing protein [Paramagnetospirillum magneticum]BAE53126.1 hypothetical protein amb4322 [Paramagnetospirillum magneticum AMB-1]